MRPRCLVVAVAALNLVAGGSFGFALGRAHPSFEHGAPACQLAHDAVHDPEFPRLALALNLEPERAAKVQAILAACGPRFDAVMEDTRGQLRAVHDKLHADLGAVLSPGELEKLKDEYRRRYGELPHGD